MAHWLTEDVAKTLARIWIGALYPEGLTARGR